MMVTGDVFVQQAPGFFGIMGQVGVTAFALMFAAAQVQREVWVRDRLGMAAMVGSLFELLALTVVSLAFASQVPHLWEVVAILLAVCGLSLTWRHHRTFQAHQAAGRAPTRSQRMQASLNMLPVVSNAALVTASVWSTFDDEQSVPVILLTVVTIWLLISGSTETFLTLSPNWLSPEDGDPGHGHVADAASHER